MLACCDRIRLDLTVCMVLLGCGLILPGALAQGADEPGKLLELAARAEPKESLQHLNKVARLIGADKTRSRDERTELTRRFVSVLMAKARSTDDIQTALGPQISKQVARQVFYHRYLEHWIIESPLALVVSFECAKGHEQVIRAIFPGLSDGP
jgi:hypothetical protein